MFCKVKKTIKEYRDFQMKMYTRVADRLEQRLAAVIAAKQKLAEQMERDTVNTPSTGTSPIDGQNNCRIILSTGTFVV